VPTYFLFYCVETIVTFFSQQTEPHAITHTQTNAKANSQTNTKANSQSNASSNAYSKSFLFLVCFFLFNVCF